MKPSMKKPQVGHTIVHKEHAMRRENTGKVIELLACQFIYQTDGGEIRHCNYTENWSYAK
tara:strand:+ start:2643 stop:2822 length:180 start_codon:yes stop_codon:yes gene_type:complete